MNTDATPASIGADALRVAAQAALTALENLHEIDTETECITIDVRDEIDALRAALASAAQPARVGTIGHVGDGPTTLAAAVAPLLAAAAAPKAAPVESSTIGDTLAIKAFQRFGVGPHTVTPYLNIDKPEGIQGYRFLCDALAMAFEAGRALHGQAPAPAPAPAAQGDAERLDWLLGEGRSMAIDSCDGEYRVVDAKWGLVVTDWMPTPRAAIDAARKQVE